VLLLRVDGVRLGVLGPGSDCKLTRPHVDEWYVGQRVSGSGKGCEQTATVGRGVDRTSSAAAASLMSAIELAISCIDGTGELSAVVHAADATVCTLLIIRPAASRNEVRVATTGSPGSADGKPLDVTSADILLTVRTQSADRLFIVTSSKRQLSRQRVNNNGRQC